MDSDLAHYYLQQLAPAERLTWLQEHPEQSESLLWSLKENAAQYHHTDPQRAVEIAQVAQEAAHALHTPFLSAIAHWINANALLFLERHAEAERHFAEAAAVLRRDGHRRALGQMLVGYVFTLAYLGRHEEAFALAEEARPLLNADDDGYRLGLLAMNIGVVHDLREDYATAVVSYRAALTYFTRLDDRFNQARATINMGLAYENMDRYREAETAYRQAETVFAAAGAKLEEGRAALNLGALFVRQGRYGEALTSFHRARTDFQALDVPLQLAEVDLHESRALIALNLFPEAESLAGQAAAVLAAQEQYGEAALATYVRGRALLGQRKYEAAETALGQALAYYERLTLPLQAARVRLSLAENAYRRGDPADAFAAARAVALEAAGKAQHALLARAFLLAGQAALAQHERDAAAKHFAAALRMGSAVRLPQLLIWAHDGLGQLAAQAEAWETAWTHQEQALALVTEMRMMIPGAAYRAAFLADKMPIFQRAVRSALADHQIARALDIIAQAQSGALVDLLLVPPEDPVLRESWDKLHQELKALKQAWSWYRDEPTPDLSDGETSTRGEKAREQVRVLEKRINRIWRQMQSLRGPASARRPGGAWAAHLPADVLLLTYFAAGETIWGFAMTPDGHTIARPLGRTTEILQQLYRWQGHLSQVQGVAPAYLQRHGSFFTQVARQLLHNLYRDLLLPFAEQIAGFSRLWIIPNGDLYGVPFAALFDGASYLVQRHRVSLLPGLGFVRPARPSPDSTGISLIGAYSDRGRLARVAYEAAAVGALVPRPVLLLEGEMTAEALRRLLGRATLVHLATHADFRKDNPLFSYLQLADGRLTAHDLEGIRLQASLVVLSACETGRGGELGGDMVGLTQAFLDAGARSLVASLWQVFDPATATLMERFYRLLADVSDPEQALADTMREILATDPTAHPYFWAPFVVMRGGS